MYVIIFRLKLENDAQIAKYLSQVAAAETKGSVNLVGSNFIYATEVDHWITVSNTWDFLKKESLVYLNNALACRTFLVGHKITLADIFVWSSLAGNYTNLFSAYYHHNDKTSAFFGD